jgi:hypothetical protein
MTEIPAESRVEGAVLVQPEHEGILAVGGGPGDNDSAVLLQGGRMGRIVSAEVDTDDGPILVEARVGQPVRVQSRDRHVDRGIAGAGDDDLAIGLHQHRIGALVASVVIVVIPSPAKLVSSEPSGRNLVTVIASS